MARIKIVTVKQTDALDVAVEFRRNLKRFTLNLSVTEVGLQCDVIKDLTGDSVADWEVSWEELIGE